MSSSTDCKTALITGGGNGIGRAICLKLASKGYKICIVDRNEDDGIQTVNDICQMYGEKKAIFVKCDLSKDTEQFENAFKLASEKLGNLRIVCNDAAILNENEWERMLQTNLFGTLRGSTLGIKYMSKENNKHGGHIINISSGAGLVVSHHMPMYTASKHGIVGYTLSMGTEYHFNKHGIKFNVICPGYVDTNLTKFYENAELWYHDFDTGFNNYKRRGGASPEVVAKAFIQILDDDVNGRAVYVNREMGIKYVDMER